MGAKRDAKIFARGTKSADHRVIGAQSENVNCPSSLAASSPVLSTIYEIRNRSGSHITLKIDDFKHLHDYEIGLNDLRQKIYISVDIYPDSLTKGKYLQTVQLWYLIEGSDPTEEAIRVARAHGVKEDEPIQFIPKQLGGRGDARNVFPINPGASFKVGGEFNTHPSLFRWTEPNGNRQKRMSLTI